MRKIDTCLFPFSQYIISLSFRKLSVVGGPPNNFFLTIRYLQFINVSRFLLLLNVHPRRETIVNFWMHFVFFSTTFSFHFNFLRIFCFLFCLLYNSLAGNKKMQLRYRTSLLTVWRKEKLQRH